MSTEAERTPLVSIVVPTFNRAPFLPETLDSLLAQDYPHVELVVVDDGSSDDTPQILENYAARCGGRLRWVRHENAGQSAAVNRGFALAAGELVTVINSDDPQPPGLLGPLVAELIADPGLVLVYPDWEMIDEHGMYIRTLRTLDYTFVDLVRWHECIPGPGTLFQRRLVEAVGGWDTAFRFCPDYDWFLRAGLAGRFKRVAIPLARWRLHGGSITSSIRGEAMAREMIAVTEKFYAREDLPDGISAVRAEAFRNAYIVAGLLVADDHGAPASRFEIIDRIDVLHHDPELRRQPTSRSAQAIAQVLEPLAREQAGTIDRLHQEIAQRDQTIAHLHAEVAARDRRVTSLQADVAERERTVTSLHAEVAERDGTVAALHAAVAERDNLVVRLHAEVAARDATINRPETPAAHTAAALPSGNRA